MRCSMDIIIPIGIYCYFDFDLSKWKVAKFSCCQTQSVNKRYLNMSETYPRKTLCETLFAGHISLQRRIRVQRYKIIYNLQNLRCTICVFFARGLSSSIRLPRGTQGYSACTLSGKNITEIPEYDSGLINKERTEYSTTSRGNRRIFTRRINA